MAPSKIALTKYGGNPPQWDPKTLAVTTLLIVSGGTVSEHCNTTLLGPIPTMATNI
ncbi:hypothetical protein JYU34_003867 [Plutella xylostella]|uniref:Uncharacterized protein n=1 Tax=Plutella xylostella TaxID=51655 RepID=A0ABQ7R148_PLUXY|nr:hypothetical protein JYU34_003867 [Plutella xylostella]